MGGNRKLWSFIEATTIEEAGETVKTQLKEAVADLFAAAIAGTRAECSRIMRDFVSAEWGTGKSTVFLSDMKLSGTGAALVNANMANAISFWNATTSPTLAAAGHSRQWREPRR